MPPLASLTRATLPALALGALLLAAPVLRAQDANNRVLTAWNDVLTLADGTTTTNTVTITFDTMTGVYTRIVTNERGEVLDRSDDKGLFVGPTSDEIRQAREAILSHPEIAPLVDQALNPTLSGGFILVQEEGQMCGPGTRCLQFDLYDVNDAAREVNRIRFVIVDARDFSVVDTDFDPRHGNATRFNR